MHILRTVVGTKFCEKSLISVSLLDKSVKTHSRKVHYLKYYEEEQKAEKRLHTDTRERK